MTARASGGHDGRHGGGRLLGALGRAATDAAARVPDDRDRVADLFRVGSIALVVLGHWLVATVLVRDGQLVTGQVLETVPETRALTYLFQVMPVFFAVGGRVNAGSWERARRDGERWAPWLRRRSRRLLGPFVPLLVTWLLALGVLRAAGVGQGLTALAAQTALLPVWFLAVYVGMIALVPATWALHRRAGAWVLVAATVLIVVVDVLHRAGVPLVGYGNYLLVWGAVHQIGYLWHDRRLPARPWVSLVYGVVAAGVVAVLVGVVGYPASMVAVQGAGWNNTDPPTAALWAFAVAQLAVLLALRGPLSRWLRRPRVHGTVLLVGSVVLTVFLWHMTALVVVAGGLVPTGVWPAPATVDARWWAMRPVWLVACTAVLAVLVLLFRRFEQLRDPLPREGRFRAVLGAAASVSGIALLMTVGIYDPDRVLGVPVGALGLLLVGLGCLGVLRPPAALEGSGRTPRR